MFNLIFPIIIFVSLAVIVFIIGRHLPEFVDIKKSSQKEISEIENKKNNWKKLLVLFKNCLLWLIEKIVEKFGQLLSLVHSWLLDNKKKREAEKNKTKPIENSGRTINQGNFFQKIKNSNESKEKEDNKKQDTSQENKTDESFFSRFKKDLKNKILEKKRKKINQVFQEIEEDDFDNSQFSDGVVSVHEKENISQKDKNKAIKEVVEVKKDKKTEINIDDEIGVDRNILEKKLIGKIAQNPKDREIYRQLGELYLKMENYCDAENCYKYILKITARDIDAIRKMERIKLLKRSKKANK